jgi:hypothetical protein
VSTVVILAVGAGILYGLGRWEGRLDQKLELWKDKAETALAAGKAYRARQDSLIARADSAEARSSRLDSEITDLRGQIRVAEDSARTVALAASSGPLDSILPRLRLVRAGRNVFQADSSGVRYLGRLAADAQRAQTVIPLLRKELGLERQKSLAFQEAARFHELRANSAEARVVELEIVVKEGIEARSCSIAGFLPCPPGGVLLIVGLVAGVALL